MMCARTRTVNHSGSAPRALYPARILLCDRGTLDGAACWPEAPAHFFAEVGSTLDDALERYDAVIFFEAAAAGGLAVEGGNPTRIESVEQALSLDRRLREIWMRTRASSSCPTSRRS